MPQVVRKLGQLLPQSSHWKYVDNIANRGVN